MRHISRQFVTIPEEGRGFVLIDSDGTEWVMKGKARPLGAVSPNGRQVKSQVSPKHLWRATTKGEKAKIKEAKANGTLPDLRFHPTQPDKSWSDYQNERAQGEGSAPTPSKETAGTSAKEAKGSKQPKLNKTETKILNGFKATGNRAITRHHYNLDTFYMPGWRDSSPMPKKWLESLVDKGYLIISESHESQKNDRSPQKEPLLMLTDKARAYNEGKSLGDWQSERVERVRGILSGPPGRGRFFQLLDELNFCEESDDWKMLMDYAENQLKDWPDKDRMARIGGLQKPFGPAHRLARAVDILPVQSGHSVRDFLASDYLKNVNHIEVGEAPSGEPRQMVQTKQFEDLLQREGLKHFKYHGPRARDLFSSMYNVKNSSMEEFSVVTRWGENSDLWAAAPYQIIRYFHPKSDSCIVKNKLKLLDLEDATFGHRTGPEYMAAIKTLADEVKMPRDEQD